VIYPQYPEEIRTAAQLHQLHRVVIGVDVRRCPVCGAPLSVDLTGHEFCRKCHRNSLVAAKSYRRRYEI
jgi:hypothetical protein